MVLSTGLLYAIGAGVLMYVGLRIAVASLIKMVRLIRGGPEAVLHVAEPIHWLVIGLAVHLSIQWILGEMIGRSQAIGFLNRASKDLLFIAFAWLVLRIIALFFFEYYLHHLKRIAIPESVQQLARGILFVAAGFLVLRFYYGLDVQKPLIGVIAFTVFAVIAFNDWLRSAFAGIALMMEDTYQEGELVQVAGYTGHVVKATWRTTVIRLLSNDYVTIPNVRILQEPITNYERPAPIHQVSVEIPVTERVRPNRIRPLLEECALVTPGVLAEPPPVIIQMTANPESNVFAVEFWVSDYAQRNRIQSRLRTTAAYRLAREGLHPPFADTEHLDEAGLLKTLRDVPLFQVLRRDSIEILARLARTVFYGEGERLFRQGEPGDSFFVILSGSVDISIDDGTGRGRDAETVVATIPAGGFFGERSLLTGEPRSAHATAHEDSRMLVIDKKAFQEILAAEPGAINIISEFLAETEQAKQVRDARRLEAAEVAAKEAARKETIRKIRKFFELG